MHIDFLPYMHVERLGTDDVDGILKGHCVISTKGESIVEKSCTEAFIEKEYQKLVSQMGGWSSKYIGRLLGTVYHTFIKEECWNFIKAFRYPTINSAF